MNGDKESSSHVPLLRALLFTDLCDSTMLVERIGDNAAAELFQQHDRLVLALQQRWRGQQIDRSDGLFLLFERPIDALGFALDYQQGLQALGTATGIALQARAGLHVGEVILWNNSADAVALGSKQVEVEGLAKPMAARLMQLARPGQILLSATAESMMRRGAGELGEVGKALIWRSFGRWRFKGVPQPMDVVGVQASSMRTSRRPRATAKAMRDIPFWRRPAAMAAETMFALVVVVGGWLLLRTEPAIAFAERDWVVVGDVRNVTGETLLDASVQQAFRISLEQSRYVNVISDLKARTVLQQMRRSSAAGLDAASAAEVAQRLGARLLLMPTLTEVGGELRLSVDVIDPQSRRTLAVASAGGKGMDSILASTDEVTAQLRTRLGEAVTQIDSDSSPLPAVTTASLDALRAYALGQAQYARGNYADALAMYQHAVAIDPDFALAWMAQVRARFANVDHVGALLALEETLKRKARLPAREALYLDAWTATLRDQAKASARWSQLAMLYPDYFAAHHNAAVWLYAENRMEQALSHAKRATDTRFELANVAQDQLGRILLARGDHEAARRALNRAVQGGRDTSHRYLGAVEASQRDFVAAERELAQATSSRHVVIERVSIAADQGQWQRAVTLAQAGVDQFSTASGFDRHVMLLPLAVAEWKAGNADAARERVRWTLRNALQRIGDRDNVDVNDDMMIALGASLLAVRLDDDAQAARALQAIAARADLPQSPLRNEMMSVVRAELARDNGDPEAALAHLQPWLTDTARIQTRVAAMHALADAGQSRSALQQAEFLARNRGLAYAELDCGYCFQTMNVVDSNTAAELAKTLRRNAAAPAAVIKGL